MKEKTYWNQILVIHLSVRHWNPMLMIRSLVSPQMTLYIPTPDRVIIGYKTFLHCLFMDMDLSQLDMFMKQLNQIRVCATPRCKGILTPECVRVARLGGAVSIKYTCSGCVCQSCLFKTSSKYELIGGCEISVALQVAFIIAGCTHMTYYKVLQQALGLDAVSWHTFQSTIERITQLS